MKALTIATSLLATLSLAASSPAMQKRATTSITLFTSPNFLGQSLTLDIDTSTSNSACVVPTLPAAFDATAASLQVTNDYGNWYCVLWDGQNCAGTDYTWFWNWDIANLDFPCNPEQDTACECDRNDPETNCRGYYFGKKVD